MDDKISQNYEIKDCYKSKSDDEIYSNMINIITNLIMNEIDNKDLKNLFK